MASVTFRVEQFEGPLDLLFQLVEREELDISQVSLATVAEQFVEHVQDNPDIPPEDLADFIVVAAKLMYMKSRLLIPSLHDPDLEEGPDLETQLREYQRFVQAAKIMDGMWNAERRSFARQASTTRRQESAGFMPPVGVTADALFHAMKRVIARLEPLLRLPQASMERVVTIHEKIRDLYRRISTHSTTSFHTFLRGAKNRSEAAVSFLALLELVKRRFIFVKQKNLFDDIDIEADPDATGDPLAEPTIVI
ncbi:segregation/condensation protein A [Patescibacteria group bacterium]|nr:segregation/condensation protein A [Patescibacteria group bacterium]